MGKIENIEWEIKDGECECRLLSKCEIVINRAARVDPQALGEWFGSAMEDKLKKVGVRGGEIASEYFWGEVFKGKHNMDEIHDVIDKTLAKKGTREMALRIGDLEDTARDALCEAAIDYIEAYKEDFPELKE